MNRSNLIRLSIVFVLAILAIVAVVVREYHIPALGDRGRANNTLGMSLGLDLSGGIHLVYQGDLSKIGDEDPGKAMQGVKDILTSRVNAYGVSEAIIQIQGKDRISIQLPGISDVEQAVDLIGSTAELEFREILLDSQGKNAEGAVAFISSSLPTSQTDVEKLSGELDSAFDSFKEIDRFYENKETALVFTSEIPRADVEKELSELGYGNVTLLAFTTPSYFNPDMQGKDSRLWVPAMGTNENNDLTPLTGIHLKNSRVSVDQQTNEPEVDFEWNDEGARLSAQITERLIGKPLGIFLDDKLISSPTVQSKIESSGRITGVTLDEARNLEILLNAGALPVPLGHFVQGNFAAGPAIQDEVDPTLGADSINKSLVAGMIGLFLVLLFMILFYRAPGLLAGIALIIYGILVLAVFKIWPVTLTLAGIAAFILSLGMAVDANVLIFERLKEELRAGRTPGAAVEAGFNRAWSAIRDSNITTLIITGILYWMGSNFAEPRVMGFALTLAIGVALSMFTAIFVTRTFLRVYVGTGLAKNSWLLGASKVEEAAHSEV